MAEYNGAEMTPELLKKTMACESADELLALAKENGVSITAEEAQAYLDELNAEELDDEVLDKVAGGTVCYMVGGCMFDGSPC